MSRCSAILPTLLAAAASLGFSADDAADATSAERVVEAPLPAGFSEPAPVGEVVYRVIPAYRAVQGPNFGACFRHIDRESIPMTAPVVMTMTTDEAGEPDRMAHMRFLFPDQQTGETGEHGRVLVVDQPEQAVVAVSIRGRCGPAEQRAAVGQLRAWCAEQEPPLEVIGRVQVLGYNSPFIMPSAKLWEVQLPVRPVNASEPAATGD